MTEEVKYQLYGETRGQYLSVKDGRYHQVLFPIDAKLEENIEALQKILETLLNAQEKLKQEQVKKDEEIVEVKV